MTLTTYYRPLAQSGTARPDGAIALAGGAVWFTHAERMQRGQPGKVVPVAEVPADWRVRLSGARAPLCGLDLATPRLMGILNVTPDSFSDGGRYGDFAEALAQGRRLAEQGADLLDIGGESTRPGSETVPVADEINRTAPVIAALVADGNLPPISIDTRKAQVAAEALGCGAAMVNDVAALTYDAAMLAVLQNSDAPLCLMHAQGDPKTMQDKPAYDNVVLDVFDFLEERVAYCVANGISRDRIVVDPGIGFGKLKHHNLALIRALSLFHGLGCAVLLGVSRKRFIGTIGAQPIADLRAPGSIALGLEGVRQAVQILRVHDIPETRQALALWQAAR